MANSEATDEKPKKEGGLSWPDMLFKVLNSFGISGLIVFCICCTFMMSATSSQKELFIDKYILLKNVDDTNFFAKFVIIIILALFLILWRFYSSKFKLQEKRIDELAKERTELQNLLYGKKAGKALASSNKEKT